MCHPDFLVIGYMRFIRLDGLPFSSIGSGGKGGSGGDTKVVKGLTKAPGL